MEIDQSYHFNPLQSKKAFEVSSLVAAFVFSHNPIKEPYWENYNFSQILLVLEGSGSYTTEDATYPIEAGMMFYRPKACSSSYQWDSEHVRYALISFVCDSPAMETFGKEPLALYEEESSTLYDLIKTATRICEPYREDEGLRGYHIKENVPDAVLGFIVSSLERFLSIVYCRLSHIDLLLDESQKVNAFIDTSQLTERVKAYLAEHISQKLTLAEVCAHFGVSQTGLLRKFRRETDQSLMDYFIDLKIAEAKRLIAKSSKSFTEIADALGFSSVNYFSKVFKARVGLTPTEYSRRASKRMASV